MTYKNQDFIKIKTLKNKLDHQLYHLAIKIANMSFEDGTIIQFPLLTSDMGDASEEYINDL